MSGSSPRPSPNALKRPLPAAPERTVELERGPQGFGFSIVGGEPAAPASTTLLPIVVSKLHPGGPAARSGRLAVGDRILRINGEELNNASHLRAVNLLRFSPAKLTLLLSETVMDWTAIAQQNSKGYAPQRVAQAVMLPTAFERVRILYNFTPQNSDELELRANDIVHVTARGRDGWCLGVCDRTQATGLFPGNFAMKIAPRPQHAEAIYADLDSVQDGPQAGPAGTSAIGPNTNASGSGNNSAQNSGSGVITRPQQPRGDNDYEELPDAGRTQQPLYQSANSVGKSDEDPEYAPLPRVVSQENDRIEMSNGDVYAVVRRPSREGNIEATGTSGGSGGTANSGPDYASAEPSEAVYSVVQQKRFLRPQADDVYARLDGDEESVTYAQLPSATAPQIPERSYNQHELLQLTQMLNAMNETTVLYESPYETLPGEKPHGDTESVTYRSTSDMGMVDDTYESLPPAFSKPSPKLGGSAVQLTGPSSALPAAPPLPPSGSRRPSTVAADQAASAASGLTSKQLKKEQKERERLEKKQREEAKKQQKKAEKAAEKQRKEQAKKEKEEEKRAKRESRRMTRNGTRHDSSGADVAEAAAAAKAAVAATASTAATTATSSTTPSSTAAKGQVKATGDGASPKTQPKPTFDAAKAAVASSTRAQSADLKAVADARAPPSPGRGATAATASQPGAKADTTRTPWSAAPAAKAVAAAASQRAQTAPGSPARAKATIPAGQPQSGAASSPKAVKATATSVNAAPHMAPEA